MNPAPPPRPRRPHWMLLAFVAFMAAPTGVATPALLAAVIAATGFRAIRWAARRRADRIAARGGEGLALAQDVSGRSVVLSDHQLSAHGLILGASGSGKSTTLLRILTEHVRRGSPVVAIDMKGSPAFARVLEDAAAAAGRPFRLWTADGPARWNPLQYGNATELKDKLIGTERFTEPHYQRAAERYVQTVLQVLHEADPERPPTLERVVRLMDPKRIQALVRSVSGPLATRVLDYLSELTPDQVSAVRGLGTRLAVITESHLGPYLSPGSGSESIDLRSALAGPEVVLFSLNSSTYGTLAAQVGTLVVQDVVAAAGARLSSGGPLAIMAIDEFSALGGDQVNALFARGREAGLCVIAATQELVDLERAGTGLRDQVLGNTALKIVHRQDVPASAQTVAQMGGIEMAWEETRRVGSPWSGRYDAGGGTLRPVERFIVHPNAIKTLRTGEAVVIAKLPRTSVRVVRVRPPERPGRELE